MPSVCPTKKQNAIPMLNKVTKCHSYAQERNKMSSHPYGQEEPKTPALCPTKNQNAILMHNE